MMLRRIILEGLFPGILLFSTPALLSQIVAGEDSFSIGNQDCHALLEKSEKALHDQDFAPAMTFARSAREQCSDPRPSLLILTHAQMLSEQFDGALASVNLLLAQNPHDMQSLILKGQILYLSNHDPEASTVFQQAIALAPKAPEPHYWLAKLLYQDRFWQQATEQFNAAIGADPGFYRAYDGLGLAYETLGDHHRAVESFLQAIKLTHTEHLDYDTAYADLAELLLHHGKNQEAFDLAAEAATRNPKNSRNFFLAGKASEQAGQDETAIRWLKKAAEIDSGYPDPHYFLARIYHRLGDKEKSTAEVAAFEKLHATAPSTPR